MHETSQEYDSCFIRSVGWYSRAFGQAMFYQPSLNWNSTEVKVVFFNILVIGVNNPK